MPEGFRESVAQKWREPGGECGDLMGSCPSKDRTFQSSSWQMPGRKLGLLWNPDLDMKSLPVFSCQPLEGPVKHICKPTLNLLLPSKNTPPFEQYWRVWKPSFYECQVLTVQHFKRVSFKSVPALYSNFIVMKEKKCTTDFHSWDRTLLTGKLKRTWASMNSMPRVCVLVPNRDCILCAVPYHYSHFFTSLKIVLGNKPPAVESRDNFPKVKQFAIQMLSSKDQSCHMTAEVFMVHSQLSSTRLLGFPINSPLLCLPFDYVIARAPANCKPGRWNGRMWFY